MAIDALIKGASAPAQAAAITVEPSKDKDGPNVQFLQMVFGGSAFAFGRRPLTVFTLDEKSNGYKLTQLGAAILQHHESMAKAIGETRDVLKANGLYREATTADATSQTAAERLMGLLAGKK